MINIIYLILLHLIYGLYGNKLNYENPRGFEIDSSKCGESWYFSTNSQYGLHNEELYIKKEDLPQPSCARPSLTSEGRIVRGTITKWTEEFPWLAEIRIFYEEKWQHLCGAAILTEFFVLTAAHCFDYFKGAPERFLLERIKVRVGENDLETDTESEEDFNVAKVLIHPDYKEVDDTPYNDVALLRLKPKNGRGIQFNLDAVPVCLPTSNYIDLPEGMTAKVAGWGHTEGEKIVSRYLRMIEIPILTNEACKKAHKSDVKSGMICAGDLSGRKDSCQGDSGGPLVAMLNRKATVVGIVSWGLDCGHPKYPGVYTNVNHYVKWILEAMEKACD